MAHATRIIDDTFTRENARECHLSVLIRSNRISYAVFDPNRNKYLGFNASYFPESKDGNLLNELRKLIPDEEIMHLTFKQTRLALAFCPAVLIPAKLYDEQQSGLNLSMQGFSNPDAKILHDEIKDLSAVVEYSIETELLNYLQGVFSHSKLEHSLSGLICGTAKQAVQNQDTVFIHVHRENFTLIAYKGQDLQLVNHFNFQSKEDFIYYILLCCEQIQFDKDMANFVFLGEIVQQSALFEISYKYLKHLSFGKRPSGVRYQRDIRSMPSHFNFNLFSLQACA